MKDCDRFEQIIRAYIAGEPVADDLESLVEHCKICQECRQLLAVHRDMSNLGAKFDELEEPDFDSLRSRVLEQVARSGRKRAERGLWSVLMAPFALRPLAAAALAVVVFFVGLAAGQIRVGSANGGAGRLLEEINKEAVSNRSLGDVEDSPYTYSNVTFRRLDDEQISLAFDVTRHVDVVESAGSDLVKEVLVHSLMNPSHTGSRLKAISFASGLTEPKVKQALLFAMRHDENLAVRLRALTILSRQPWDGEVESAVLATLREDDSVQMRLEALDYLAARSVDHDLLRRTIQELEGAADPALMVRLAEYRR